MFYKQFLKISKELNEEFVKDFDYWLATIPDSRQDNISASLVASKFNVHYSLAQMILEYAKKEGILEEKYLVKCPKEKCGMIIDSISNDQIAKVLMEPIWCANCFKKVKISPENIFVAYKRIVKPDISDETLNVEILKRLNLGREERNFNIADSLDGNSEKIYQVYYHPDESAYKILKELREKLDWNYGKNTTAKGNALEVLALTLVKQIEGVSGTNELKTYTNQFDCTVSFPHASFYLDLYNYLSPYFIIECKNEKNTPSNTYFHKLSNIMSTNNAQFGIIFSRKPASREDKDIAYQQYLLNRNQQFQKVMISISDEDLKFIIDERVNLLKYLDFKIMELTTNAKNADFKMFDS